MRKLVDMLNEFECLAHQHHHHEDFYLCIWKDEKWM